MLSEAYDLRRSLDEIGFDIPTNHPDVKKPGKNPGYRVGLGNEGLPQIVEEVDRESMGRLWYHREGKANAFPVVKIQHALLSVPDSPELFVGDVDIPAFFRSLQENRKADQIIRKNLGSNLDHKSEKELIAALNLVIKLPDLYSMVDANAYKPSLPEKIQKLIEEAQPSKESLKAAELERMNRALLEVIYPQVVHKPLRERFAALKKSEKTQQLKLLREAIDNREFQLAEHDEQTWNRLRSKALDWLNIFVEVDEPYLALPCMLRRFAESMVSPADMLRRLCQLIVQRLEQGHLQEVALAQKLLVGVPDKKRPAQPAKAEVPVVLDVAEPDYQVSVADPKMGSYVSRWLRTNEKRANEKKDPDGICALQGVPRHLLKQRFPEPKLGALGEAKLFSKNKDTPCEFRYLKNRADWEDASKSFPIDQWLAADIADGLSALTMPDLRGKTWRTVANGKWEGSGPNKREKKDLLLVYCEGQPVISKEAANVFGSDEREKRDQFENDAKALCRTLDGIIKHRPQSRLHLLLIGKADKEKKQIFMHMTIEPQEMLDAAERWHQGVRKNLPTITLTFPPEKKGQKAVERQPLPPYPDRVVRLLSSKWVRGGTDELKLDGPALRQVLAMMLRSPGKCEEAGKNLLRLTIQRIGPLLVGVAAAFHSGEKEQIEKFKPVARQAALRAVALLGILLDALGQKKEVYMEDTAFQLGRLLSMADTVHREYCMLERKGSIPPQLIGNALMPAAADNPEDAIDRLRERMNIYQAWATKISGEKSRLAKWAVGQMGEICHAIKRPLPTKTGQTFRAELFLGYMARSPKEDK